MLLVVIEAFALVVRALVFPASPASSNVVLLLLYGIFQVHPVSAIALIFLSILVMLLMFH